MDKRALRDVIDNVARASDIPQPTKDAIVGKLRDVVSRPLETDKWIYRMVVFFLGAVVLVTVIGGIYLTSVGGTSQNFQIPQGIVAIGSAAVGALAGLLAPPPQQG